MDTIRCSECDEVLPESTQYCPSCGISRTSLGLRSDDNWLAMRRSATWRKEVVPLPGHTNIPLLPPRPVRSRPPMWNTWRRIYYKISPGLIVWTSFLVFIILAFGGVFGIVATLGRGVNNPSSDALSLQVTPNTFAVGATVMLSGTHFSPHGKIGLTRDSSSPVLDTANAATIDADNAGDFSDTIIITDDWEAGSHVISAEDAFKHKVASFSVNVTGYAASLRPAHLRISADTLNLGSADQATDTTRTLLLTNIGSGLISWQASSAQPWLLLSSKSGTLSQDHSVQLMVAVERSKLNPGIYHTHITIVSIAGSSVIPVTAVVTTLPVSTQGAILQTSPTLLSFMAIDGGSSPPSQVITVNNPGTLPLAWQATTNVDWLSASPHSATVAPATSLPVTINVDSSLLLPGTYNATVTLSSLESGSSQTVFITVTIMPQCSLLITPGQLNFASIYQQGSPTAKTVNLGTSQGCNVSSWQAVSNASWLTINKASAQTPTSPKVDINVSGLLPGVYTSSILFSSATGTQTLPVTFILSKAATSLVTTTPAAISFHEITGHTDPAMQSISITNSGDAGSLSWNATATTSAGGNWLTVYPAEGTIPFQQSISFHVIASIVSTMLPGTYHGSVMIVARDSVGNSALGSPQVIPVNLIIKPACTFTVTPQTLSFSGISGQTALISQHITPLASAACSHMLNWTATTSGDSWLSTASDLSVNADLTHLKAGNYSGAITIIAWDSVTKELVGIPQVVPVALTVQPACTLQNPSSATESFDTSSGSNPPSQTFTLSVAGACSGNVTITSNILFNSGSGWLKSEASKNTLISGGSATFTVTVTSASLPVGMYRATIQLSGSDAGAAIANSPQTVLIQLKVEAATNSVAATPTTSPTPFSTSSLTPTPTP